MKRVRAERQEPPLGSGMCKGAPVGREAWARSSLKSPVTFNEGGVRGSGPRGQAAG